MVLLLVSVTTIGSISFRNTDTLPIAITRFYEKTPFIFLLSSSAFYVALAFLFKVRVPLLGDSYVIINILEHAISGEQALRTYSEPLSILYFYGLSLLMGATESAGIQQAFFIGEIILGIGFIANIFFISRILSEDASKRILLFGFLFVLPSLQLFFGYIEWYPVVLFSISLCVLTVTLYIRGRIPIYIVMFAYALLVMTHLLNGLLFPAMLYLAYKEIKSNGYKNFIIGLAGILFIFLGLYWQYDFNPLSLLHREGPSLFLSPFGDIDPYHAYSLFSFNHGLDLMNLSILLFPMVYLLLGYLFFYDKKELYSTVEGKLLLLYAVPFAVFIFLFRFDLGMAKDWDIPATFIFPVYVFSAYLFIRAEIGNHTKMMSVVIVTSAFLVLPYFQLNSTVDENIKRYKTLLDSPLMSREAYFGAVSHLSKYYYNEKNLTELGAIWTDFSAKYPNDWRGYRALTNSKIQLGDPNNPEITSMFNEWIKRDPTKQSMKEDYLNYCMQMSKRYYRSGTLDSALVFNYRAIQFDSSSATLYNNLGVLYKVTGNKEQAVDTYKKAISLDTTYVLSYINLANLYDDLGRTEDAIIWYKNGLAHDSANSDIYENMAIAYYKLKDGNNYILSMTNAARYGSKKAQQYLLQHGMTW